MWTETESDVSGQATAATPFSFWPECMVTASRPSLRTTASLTRKACTVPRKNFGSITGNMVDPIGTKTI